MVKLPLDIDVLPPDALKPLVIGLLEEVACLTSEVAALRDEVARLKGLKGKPNIKPSKSSGMDKATDRGSKGRDSKRRQRGPKVLGEPHEKRVMKADNVPPGSRFKGYQSFTVQDLKIEIRVVQYLRERWVAPDGRTIVADLPAGIDGHFGPELKRFILTQYHQGQTTVPRLVAFLEMLDVSISERQVMRFLIRDKEPFIGEARDVLRAGLSGAGGAWVSVDDTGARHRGRNGYCTQIGNDRFTFFATTASKSRLNFLSLLRAGHTDYVLNDAAFDYMRERKLAGTVIALLAGHPRRRFDDEAAWKAHLDSLGISAMKAHPGPATIATEGALWGAVVAHGFLDGMVILSDDAGQFNVGIHALCWIHAERLVYKLDAFTDAARRAKERIRARMWWLYADLKAYREAPSKKRHRELERRFHDLFTTRTGFATLDRLLGRLHANKAELLRVLDHPDIPLHTNGTENDVRAQVTRRKVSGTTRSEAGRDCRDTFPGLMKTCHKLGISFWDYLGDRLGINPGTVPRLADLLAPI
ncbi:MAG: transposase [bacterium]|nr:transposase [bacterium]